MVEGIQSLMSSEIKWNQSLPPLFASAHNPPPCCLCSSTTFLPHKLTKVVGKDGLMKTAAEAELETCFSALPTLWYVPADVSPEEAPNFPENSPKKVGKTQTISKQDGWIWLISTFRQEWLAKGESSQNGSMKLYGTEEKSCFADQNPETVCCVLY